MLSDTVAKLMTICILKHSNVETTRVANVYGFYTVDKLEKSQVTLFFIIFQLNIFSKKEAKNQDEANASSCLMLATTLPFHMGVPPGLVNECTLFAFGAGSLNFTGGNEA